MTNNPFMMALQMAQAGKNPMNFLQSIAGQNAPLAQALKLINGKTPDQLRTVAVNMAKQRGIDLEKMAQSMGIKI